MRFTRQFIVAFVLFALMKTYFYPTVIPSESMVPTLLVNDYVLYTKTDDVEVGDIVLFKLNSSDEFLTKRIVAIGDKEETVIEVKNDGVYVNEAKLIDGYSNMEQGLTMKKTILKEGELFMMGDNRTNSADSRVFGPITKDKIQGKIFMRIPFGKIIKEEK